MFAPIVDYHSGGAPAALEPLSEHIVAWNWTLGIHIGAGVGACYRGSELYDSPEVEAMVQFWAAFWNKYRSILTADIIHIRRPDQQNIDGFVHVTSNSSASIVALAMFYNPAQTSNRWERRVEGARVGACAGPVRVLTRR